MELYICIYGLLFLSAFGELFSRSNTNSRHIMLLWCVFFTFFGGLRWDIGGDFMSSVELFERAEWSNIFNFDRYGNGEETLEPGYVFLNVVSKSLGGYFPLFDLFMCAFLQYSIYKFCVRLSPQYPLLAYCMVISLGFRYIFPVRSMVAFSFIFWAYIYFMERNLKKYLLVVFCACSIHYMTLVAIPLYWFPKIKFKVKFWHGLILFTMMPLLGYKFRNIILLLAIYLEGDIGDKVNRYAGIDKDPSSAGASLLLGILLNLFFLAIYVNMRKKRQFYNEAIFNSLLLCYLMVISISSVFSQGMQEFVRIIGVFVPAQIVLFMMGYSYMQTTRYRTYASLFFVVYYIYRINKTLNSVLYIEEIVPYRNIFDVNIPIFDI